MGGRQRATASRKRSATIAVGYVRVSTDEQVLGPEAQRVALARWAEARGVQLVVIHEDRGVSGAADLDRRPGLLAALDSLERHNAGFLVAAKRDRFARDVIIVFELRVDSARADFLNCDPPTDTPGGWTELMAVRLP